MTKKTVAFLVSLIKWMGATLWIALLWCIPTGNAHHEQQDADVPPVPDAHTTETAYEDGDLLLPDGEVLNKRTTFSKTYRLDDGHYRLTASRYPLHVKTEEGVWQEIDRSVKNGVVDNGVYKAVLMDGAYGYSVQHADDSEPFMVRLKTIGGITPEWKDPIVDRNEVKWKEIVQGIDLLIRFHPHRIRIWRRIKDKSSPHEIEWDIEEPRGKSHLQVVQQINGYDSSHRHTHNERIKKEETLDEKRVSYILADRFTGKVRTMVPETRVSAFSPLAHYPVIIDADIDVVINNTANDGMAVDRSVNVTTSTQPGGESGTKTADTTVALYSAESMNYVAGESNKIRMEYTWGGTGGESLPTTAPTTLPTAGTMAMGQAISLRYESFLRFEGITIPKDAGIVSADVGLYVSYSPPNEVITVRGKDQNDPVAPTSVNQVFTPGTLASAQVNWQPASVPFSTATTGSTTGKIRIPQGRSINVKPIVQELVNSYNYEDESMLFFLKRPWTAGGTRTIPVGGGETTGTGGESYRYPLMFYEFSADIPEIPTLTIEYTAANLALKKGIKINAGSGFKFRAAGE